MSIEAIGPERFAGANKLRRSLADRPRISFSDLTSMVVMRDLGGRRILTAGEHFLHVGRGLDLPP